MLRNETSPARRRTGIALVAAVGALAAALVLLGNPGNMGLCGACFVRDVAGALRLHQGPAVFRPEVAGLVFGALAWSLLSGRHVGRSGSNAVARFVLGVAMAIGALVFLGCPFRMLQRLGGGDLNAWLALPGFVAGVGVGRWFERRGYSIGKTHEVPLAVGLIGPLAIAALLVLFALGDVLAGPGPGGDGPPAHAPWLAALALAGAAGAILSATGFCGINAARQLFGGPRAMLVAAVALVGTYGLVLAIGGRFAPGLDAQPIAHGAWLWNTLGLMLVGLTGALCGGCPVRLVVLTGEGNGDAFVAVMGLLVGGALAHTLGLSAAPASAAAAGGPALAGKVAVLAALVLAVVYAAALVRSRGQGGGAA
ncbi:MAG: YedE-related selenium metabolism membrane protein [Planctomycetes bacterium]|nr:YedE-related selenium metabolism membrane protein [Planctomycetota bacterium]